MLDVPLSKREHVSWTAYLRRLRSVRQLHGRDVTIQLVVALVFLRLDYCNAVLAGLPAITLAPLQRVLHAAAYLVNDPRPHTPCYAGTQRTSLVADSSTDRVQTVLARTRVTDQPCTGLH